MENEMIKTSSTVVLLTTTKHTQYQTGKHFAPMVAYLRTVKRDVGDSAVK